VCSGVGSLAGVCSAVIALMSYPSLVATLPLMIAVFSLIGLFMVDVTLDSNSRSVMHEYLHGMSF